MPLKSNQTCEVILLDDDEDDFFFLQKAFQAYSDQVTLHFLSSNDDLLGPLQTALTLPSLIMLDMHLGAVNGFEVLAMLRQDQHLRDIPVVVWSGSLMDEEVNRCYQRGASWVVLKSTDQKSLELNIRRVCEYWLEAVQLPFYQKKSDC